MKLLNLHILWFFLIRAHCNKLYIVLSWMAQFRMEFIHIMNISYDTSISTTHTNSKNKIQLSSNNTMANTVSEE